MFRMHTVDRPVPLPEDPHSGRPSVLDCIFVDEVVSISLLFSFSLYLYCSLVAAGCHLLRMGVLVPSSYCGFLCSGRIADQRPHRYSTRLNHQRNMDQVQAELAEMRANMAQFIHMMQGVAQGQEELRALVQRQEAVIPPPNQALPEGNPVPDTPAAAIPVNNYAVGEELRGIRVDGQPIAPDAANARVIHAPARNRFPIVDRQEDLLTMLSEDDDILGRNDARDRKVEALAEKIRAMECQNSLGFDVTNMGLVEGLRIPHKFKAPSFDKYNGTSYPRTHVQAYYRKISAYTDDEKMWMYFFQDSLSGASLDWYMELKRDSIRC
ncbi:hypothetical protein KIW84_060372 [Lathyrus oleraceus]|uniref:Uncharacterized protein n=1 Tax=Pisum sativum TaxID=3888 RepID=A0A9D4W0R7_PEA|nr:hypothetical protein KIW84_060372 [Pisum sativum]